MTHHADLDHRIIRRQPIIATICYAMLCALVVRTPVYADNGSIKPAPSQQAAEVSFKNGAQTTAWLNFEMPDARRIILHARINDVPVRILLDSGVGTIVLDKTFAASLKLRAIGSVTEVGVTAYANGQEAEGVRVDFDNLTVQTSKANILDLSGLAGFVDEPVVALIGRDLFDSLIVDIDFEHQRLAFRDPTTRQTLSGGTELTLTRGILGARRLPVSLEGKSPIQASFDLGSTAALVLSSEYASEENLLSGKRTSNAAAIGIGGGQVGEVAVLDRLAIGQMVFHNVPIQVPETWTLDCPAIVGFPLLRRMHMVIDYPHDRLEVLPNTAVFDRPIRKDRSGIGARRLGDALQVVHIARGSPAEAAGLRVGDEIIAINGEKLTPEYFKNHPTVGSMPAGTVFHLTLSSGSKVKLTLADYF